MWKPFEPGSSPVDWCEGNYNISPIIAEFTNTVCKILNFIYIIIHNYVYTYIIFI